MDIFLVVCMECRRSVIMGGILFFHFLFSFTFPFEAVVVFDVGRLLHHLFTTRSSFVCSLFVFSAYRRYSIHSYRKDEPKRMKRNVYFFSCSWNCLLVITYCWINCLLLFVDKWSQAWNNEPLLWMFDYTKHFDSCRNYSKYD